MATSIVIARLNDRARPMDRGDIYEDPLHEVLEEKGIGEVSGGGSQLGEKNEIMFVDLEISLTDTDPAHNDLIIAKLEELGAPKGSLLISPQDDSEVPFGRTEGLAVYLNGTDLPAEVYQESDVNHVFDEFNRLLGDEGQIHSYWEGPEETALYMYGNSFETMKGLISEFMESYPLCQKARVERVA